MKLLSNVGYKAAGEVKLKIIPDFQRLIFRWQNNALAEVDSLAGIAGGVIWSALDRELKDWGISASEADE